VATKSAIGYRFYTRRFSFRSFVQDRTSPSVIFMKRCFYGRFSVRRRLARHQPVELVEDSFRVCLGLPFTLYVIMNAEAFEMAHPGPWKLMSRIESPSSLDYSVHREKALVFSGWESRPGTGSLRPVATEAAVEVTKLLEPSV
jgi:hypothetical protein